MITIDRPHRSLSLSLSMSLFAGSNAGRRRQDGKGGSGAKKVRPHTVSGRLGVRGSMRRMGIDCGKASGSKLINQSIN